MFYQNKESVPNPKDLSNNTKFKIIFLSIINNKTTHLKQNQMQPSLFFQKEIAITMSHKACAIKTSKELIFSRTQ